MYDLSAFNISCDSVQYLLFTVIKPKDKNESRGQEFLCSLKKHSFPNASHFSEIYQHTIFRVPALNGATVVIGSKISTTVIPPHPQHRLGHKTDTCTVKWSLMLFKNHVMKTFGVMEI
jgi:hypothetical protein